jgi:predicted RNA-binding protein with PIN domain
MALLIDGYNVLHVSDIFAGEGAGTELHRVRLALLDYLAAAIDERERNQTTIVFDAAGAPPGLPQTLTHEGMTVRFARRHTDADELIEEIIEQHAAPRELTVVSSDHRVQRAARRRGATFVDSEQWFANLKSSLKAKMAEPTDSAAKPKVVAAFDDVAYWVDQFADGPPERLDENPFPPGYGDDLVDE